MSGSPTKRLRFSPRVPCIARSLLVTAIVLVLAASCGDDDTSPSAPTVPPGSTYSIASYREAARITAVGAVDAVSRARPGQTEGAVKGIIDGAFRAQGCTQTAFDPIVAAGVNAIVLHYSGDESLLVPGELLLIDIGAAWDGIAADCSRTFPVDSAFDARQRELYELVLEVQRHVVSSARPGLDSLTTLNRRARDRFRASPVRARDENNDVQAMDVFFKHGIGHYVGKSIHGEDTGWSPAAPLAAGQVLAIEPGLYIASERIGIRIEDTYLVTETGLECLTSGCPKDVAQVEALRAALLSDSALAIEGTAVVSAADRSRIVGIAHRFPGADGRGLVPPMPSRACDGTTP